MEIDPGQRPEVQGSGAIPRGRFEKTETRPRLMLCLPQRNGHLGKFGPAASSSSSEVPEAGPGNCGRSAYFAWKAAVPEPLHLRACGPPGKSLTGSPFSAPENSVPAATPAPPFRPSPACANPSAACVWQRRGCRAGVEPRAGQIDEGIVSHRHGADQLVAFRLAQRVAPDGRRCPPPESSYIKAREGSSFYSGASISPSM